MQLIFHEVGGKAVISITDISREDAEGWRRAMVFFNYNEFTASFSICLMTNDIKAFLPELSELNKRLQGQARFATIEENLDLVLSGDGMGHIEIKGLIRHDSNYHLVLNFSIPSDQSFLSRLIAECEVVLKN